MKSSILNETDGGEVWLLVADPARRNPALAGTFPPQP
jgi:hypothetical protein